MVVTAAPYTIRPVGAADEPGIAALLEGLDPDSRYLRWFSYAVDIRRASHWAAHPEVDAALGFVAVADGETIGHAVLIPLSGDRGEVAFEVAAHWRRHGVAGALLEAMVEAAVASGMRELQADVLAGNTDMLAVLREHGRHAELREGGVVSCTMPMTSSGA